MCIPITATVGNTNHKAGNKNSAPSVGIVCNERTIMFESLLLAAVIAGGPDPTSSVYTGKWYVEHHEPIRRCIVHRESRGNYRAVNRRSSARGAYQFLDSQWRKSLVWMLIPEHKDKVKEVRKLRDKPIHHWSRYWQDAAFWVAWQRGKGRSHWSLQQKECW